MFRGICGLLRLVYMELLSGYRVIGIIVVILDVGYYFCLFLDVLFLGR